MATRKQPTVAQERSRDPRERFLSLANSRVSAAIHQIRLVGNLANRKNYQYEQEEATKIVRTLQRELDEIKSKFKGAEKNESSVFSL